MNEKHMQKILFTRDLVHFSLSGRLLYQLSYDGSLIKILPFTSNFKKRVDFGAFYNLRTLNVFLQRIGFTIARSTHSREDD
jgi:hypothetical protein